MLLAAARRFLILLAATVLVGVAGSIVLGAVAGSSFRRSLALGFYGMGSFLLIIGFFVGNRAPTRVRDEPGPRRIPLFQPLRWATPQERNETIGTSAIFLTLGTTLLLLGVLADGRYELV